MGKDRGRSLFKESGQYGNTGLSDGVIDFAMSHEEIKGAFSPFQKDADQIYPGWTEELTYLTVLDSASWLYREAAFSVVGEIIEELSKGVAGGGAFGHRDGPTPGAVSCRRREDAWKDRKRQQRPERLHDRVRHDA